MQSSNLEYNVSSAKSTADSEVQTSETDKIPENGTSSEKFSAANTISIPYSDLDFWLNTQYQISNFYGYFSSPHLNVMISVENSGVTEGYVTYHYDMQQLYQKRSGLLGILQMVFLPCMPCADCSFSAIRNGSILQCSRSSRGLPNMPTEI